MKNCIIIMIGIILSVQKIEGISAKKIPLQSPTEETFKEISAEEFITTISDSTLDEIKELFETRSLAINKFWGDLHNTALNLAISRGNEEIVEYFLKIGANINLRSGLIFEMTPLYTAIFYDQDHLVPLLLNHPNIDVNKTSGFKTSALHLAAQRGKTDIVRHLLKADEIQVNVKGPNYLTPLQCAISKGHKLIVWELVKDPRVRISKKHVEYVQKANINPITRAEIKALLETRFSTPEEELELKKWIKSEKPSPTNLISS